MAKQITLDSTLIGTKDAKIAILTNAEQLRAEQLMLTNKELDKKNAEIKKLHRKIFLWKAATVVGVVGMMLILR